MKGSWRVPPADDRLWKPRHGCLETRDRHQCQVIGPVLTQVVSCAVADYARQYVQIYIG